MKGRKHRAEGGVAEFKQDLESKPERRVYAPKIEDEAEAKKDGGKVKGKEAKKHAGRKARKAGGRAGSDMSPLSSAHKGTDPKGHKTFDID
jgi:hypothetical protein